MSLITIWAKILFPAVFPRYIAGISAGTAAALAASAAASIGGSMMQGNAADKAAGTAADAQIQSNRDSIEAQKEARDQAIQLGTTAMRPWETAGYGAQDKLNYLLGIGPRSVGLEPDRKAFEKAGPDGTTTFDKQGYDTALAHWQARAQNQNLQKPSEMAFKVPVYNKRGKLTGYKTDQKAFKAAMQQWKGKIFEEQKQAAAGTSPGQTAAGGYGSLMQDFTPEQYQEDPGYTPMVNDLESLQATPGYQFRLEQGEQSVNRSAAAKGGLLSGATAKALTDYGQGLASTEYNNAWQRAQSAYQAAFDRYQGNRTQKYNMLSTQAGRGQNAAQTIAGLSSGAATNAGNNIAQIQQNTGNNLANIAMANGQAQGNMWGNIGNSVNAGIGNALAANQLGWGNGNKQGGV